MVFIIIPVHNRRALTAVCLACLSRQSTNDFRIVVVDDGSTDDTSKMIASDFPSVVLLKGDGNLWWAGSMNLGVQYALENGAKYILSLNDDTEPPEVFVETMLHAASEKPGCLIGTSAIEKETGTLVYAGERIDWLRAKYKQLVDSIDPEQPERLIEVTHFPGRGLLVPSRVFEEIGLYDSKHFPQTLADYDFTHRAKRAGYDIFCSLDSRLVIHSDLSATVSLRKERNIRNYYTHLFGLRGGANIPRFIRYGLKNAPVYYAFPFVLFGMLRRVVGYWKS